MFKFNLLLSTFCINFSIIIDLDIKVQFKFKLTTVCVIFLDNWSFLLYFLLLTESSTLMTTVYQQKMLVLLLLKLYFHTESISQNELFPGAIYTLKYLHSTITVSITTNILTILKKNRLKSGLSNYVLKFLNGCSIYSFDR